MSAAIKERHDDVLRQIAERYSRDGYSVVLEPRIVGDAAPVVPDLIATRGPETVMIEVVLATSAAPTPRLRDYAELARQRGWRFVIAIADGRDFEEVEVQDSETLRGKLVEARAIDPSSTAASLMAWSVLEAAARNALLGHGARPARPLAPRVLVQSLAHMGLITSDEERRLVEFAAIRNRLAHGVWTSAHDASAVQAVLALAERLMEESSTPSPPASSPR